MTVQELRTHLKGLRGDIKVRVVRPSPISSTGLLEFKATGLIKTKEGLVLVAGYIVGDYDGVIPDKLIEPF